MKSAILFFVLSIVLIPIGAIGDDKDEIVGTWTLVRIEILNEDGNWEEWNGQVSDSFAERMGGNPFGLIMYDDAGNMAVNIMRRNRPEFESDNVVNIEADKIKPAYTGYSAYFGTYEVRESEGIVLHRRTGNLIPNYVGSEVKRAYNFEGDRLMLSAAPGRRLVWRKLN
jgi:hypothetical protein